MHALFWTAAFVFGVLSATGILWAPWQLVVTLAAAPILFSYVRRKTDDMLDQWLDS